jgi:hypothetical protein
MMQATRLAHAKESDGSPVTPTTKSADGPSSKLLKIGLSAYRMVSVAAS